MKKHELANKKMEIMRRAAGNAEEAKESHDENSKSMENDNYLTTITTKGTKNMTVFERISEHLEKEIGEFYVREDNEAVMFNCMSEMMEDTLECTIFMDEDSFVVVVKVPFACNMGSLDEMAKFLVQINCGMWMGNFDLDYDDGEITFRCFMNALDCMPSDETIGTAIVSAVKAIELNAEDMHQVATGAATAREVIYANETKVEQ